MKRFLLLGLIGFAGIAALGQDISVSGKVSYVSSGTVYVSAGRGNGLRDSMIVYVVAGKDTVASMKVFAISSKSSACTVLQSKRDVVVGDVVVGRVKQEEKREVTALRADSAAVNTATTVVRPAKLAEIPAISLFGRVSLQYYAAQFDNSAYNLNQPGLVLSLSATARDLPLRLEIYGNMRSVSRGGLTPFSGGSSNDSRIYRLSLEYDDQYNIITVGRILPIYAPSIGSIDGVSYARRFGSFLAGGAVGFQPSYSLQGVSTNAQKVSFFTRYLNHDFYDLNVTAAYARTTISSQLDREAVSLGINAYSAGGLSIYGYSDIDLQTRTDNQLAFSPTVSSAMFMINYRLADFLSVGLGADVSRPVYLLSTIQPLADSLMDHVLRSGATFTVNLYLANSLGIYNSFTPRSFDAGFGKEYTNYSSVYWSNALSTGVMVRGTVTMTSNGFARSQGYGLNLQRNFLGVDLTARYQLMKYTILQLDEANRSETFGADLMVLLSTRLSWIMSFDGVSGYGSRMNSLFTELSWRF
jgi:hypothetical protein